MSRIGTISRRHFSLSISQNNFVQFGAIATNVSQLLEQLGSILWAVPKNKASWYRVKQRRLGQLQEPNKNIRECPVCNNPVFTNTLCLHCLKNFVKAKIVEIGDEVKGKPKYPNPLWGPQVITKARGVNNTYEAYKQRKQLHDQKV